MKRLLIFAAAALALFACQPENSENKPPTRTATRAQPQNLGQAKVNAVLPMNASESLVQSRLGDGKVDKTTFKPGEPIVVTLTLRDNPKGVELKTQWLDAKGRMMKEDKQELFGQKTAQFSWSGKKLKPGNYRAVSYWGENVAGDHKFAVTK